MKISDQMHLTQGRRPGAPTGGRQGGGRPLSFSNKKKRKKRKREEKRGKSRKK